MQSQFRKINLLLGNLIKGKFIVENPQQLPALPMSMKLICTLIVWVMILINRLDQYPYIHMLMFGLMILAYVLWNYLVGYNFRQRKFNSVAALTIHMLFLSTVCTVIIWTLVVLLFMENCDPEKIAYIEYANKRLAESPFWEQFYIIANMGRESLELRECWYDFSFPNYELTLAEVDLVREWFTRLENNLQIVPADMLVQLKQLLHFHDLGYNVNNYIDMTCVFYEDSSTILLAKLFDLLLYKWCNLPAFWLSELNHSHI